MEKKKNIALLGSTGSIGTQALEVIRDNPDRFQAEVLTANNNADLLIQQALEFNPNAVVVTNEAHYDKVKEALSATDTKVFAGEASLCEVVEMDTVDMVLTAMVGFSGLKPTLSAIQAGKPIALANKETLVVAGEIVTQMAKQKGVNIYPVDSEHSAIFQCLAGEFHNKIEKIYLTASGGPFYGKDDKFLYNVTPRQALKHPRWEMGSKITIDSATLMNKGLEVIEAKWLFGLESNQIEVVVHPESIVHSMVQFEDGSIKAQMGLPDMKLPIQYAFSYPNRIAANYERFDFVKYPSLNFKQPDFKTFKCLDLAYRAMEMGGNIPCILNAANEIAVAAFLEERIGFLDIAELVERCMSQSSFIQTPTMEDYMQTDKEVRLLAQNLLIDLK